MLPFRPRTTVHIATAARDFGRGWMASGPTRPACLYGSPNGRSRAREATKPSRIEGYDSSAFVLVILGGMIAVSSARRAVDGSGPPPPRTTVESTQRIAK